MHAANGAFSTSFSTIVRTTRGPPLDSLVRASETHGKAPLPARLARAGVALRYDGDGGDGDSGGGGNGRTGFVVVEKGVAVVPSMSEVELRERRAEDVKKMHVSSRQQEVGRDSSQDSLLVEHTLVDGLSYRSPT
jgi:hypothetical protein